jgi:hypothetical protein
LGVIFKLQGNMAGALSEFQQEIEVNPENNSAREQAQEIEAAGASGRTGQAPGNAPPGGVSSPH